MGGGGKDSSNNAPPSSSSDPSDSKHEQKLQAVLLADSFSSAFHPITLEPYRHSDFNSNSNDDPNNATATKCARGRERPLTLCPVNGVPLLRHAIDFLQGSGVEELFVLCCGGRGGADSLGGYLRGCVGAESESGVDDDDDDGSNGGRRIAWSSKLTISVMRFTDCTNVGE